MYHNYVKKIALKNYTSTDELMEQS